MAKIMVKCLYCGELFDRNDPSLSFVKIGRRYAHLKCAQDFEASKPQEEKDKEALEKYIMNLFNEDKINIKIRRQIKRFKEELNYSYSGILKALIYHYEVNNGDISKANGGIAIVEWVYKEAFNYYYNLWLTNQKNEHKNIDQYIPQTQQVYIPTPERKPRKKNLFSFLNEREEKNEF